MSPMYPSSDIGTKIVDAVNDQSTSFEVYATPVGVRLPTPYKSRSSPFKSITPGPRASFKIVERLSLASLPDEISADDLHDTQLTGAHAMDGDWTDEDDKEDVEGQVADDTDFHEGHSVALQDILLQAADTTQFDLLGR